MKTQRRTFLKGLGGFSLALPVLEGLRTGGTARAGEIVIDPYAIFLRQANGCASAQNTEVGAEPERFWPSAQGELTPATMAGRAIDELTDHYTKILAVGVDGINFDYGDGHARGALQGLTARGPVVAGAGGDSEANGESIDHRIGRELNPDGRDSLFLYAGRNNGWLGGACISYRGPGNRRAPLHNPLTAYQTMMGIDGGVISELLIERRKSVNDLVREQMDALLTNPALSNNDVQRLELHRSSIRDLEDTLACNLTAEQEAALEGESAGYDSDNGDLVLAAVRAHMDVAVLAVACGYTRSVAIQVGNGNDASTRYTNTDNGELMENYHFISHRRLSHDSSGAVIPGSDLLHHQIDRHFARTFKYLLDRLAEYQLPVGNLLDAGVSVWINDQAQGPSHSSMNLPYIMAGSAGGYFRQGAYVRAQATGTHCRLLNMIGTAVGLRSASGGDLDDFGDPSSPKEPIPELLG
ncbi:DUF1552 domain-containing protein [Paraliomyxa miuraensis]|uniref:DUF1552 domain-containing protein n=1 Tax=Paraliomyxa miuraensis TaxID=376150 RepID=UPI002252CC22|nr:DUF1552 domain-containing protein [Paraliomyxa miuraensis]MCX4244008.1 DUF1552 domain-containing protein [Paraliomyxa miuraensis]